MNHPAYPDVLDIIFENTHTLIAYLDSDFNFIRVNNSYAKADSKTPEYFQGLNHFDLFPQPENESIFRQVVKTGKPYFSFAKAFEYHHNPERGVTYWDWSLTPVIDASGNVSSLILQLIDVTARIEAEKAQRVIDKRYQILANVAPVGIFHTDRSGNCNYVNNRWCTITGMGLADALGKGWSNALHPGDRERVFEEWQSAVSKSIPFKSEYRFRNKEGKVTWVQGHSEAELDSEGNIKGFVGVILDITQRRNQEAKSLQFQKMEALGQLSVGVAHDFNNLLGVINGFSELLEVSLKNHKDLQYYAQKITHTAQRGSALTSKLMSFAKKRHSTGNSVDLNQLLLGEKDILERALASEVQLKFDLEVDPWAINVDLHGLSDCILNLCINARDALQDGGLITFRTRNQRVDSPWGKQLHISAGEYVTLSVIDNGCGMDEETVARVFEPYFSTKGSKGTGLGMSQVYGFVTSNAGGIHIVSELGTGTSITLFFPRQAEPVEEESLAERSISDSSGTEAILVVDDEVSLANVTSELLESLGYKVFTGYSALEAMDILRRHPVDVLFTDIIMPDINGIELANEVSELFPDVKIITTSGNATELPDLEISDSLANNLLQKPYSVQTLTRKIRELLD